MGGGGDPPVMGVVNALQNRQVQQRKQAARDTSAMCFGRSSKLVANGSYDAVGGFACVSVARAHLERRPHGHQAVCRHQTNECNGRTQERQHGSRRETATWDSCASRELAVREMMFRPGRSFRWWAERLANIKTNSRLETKKKSQSRSTFPLLGGGGKNHPGKHRLLMPPRLMPPPGNS